jgi:hypothetical protein
LQAVKLKVNSKIKFAIRKISFIFAVLLMFFFVDFILRFETYEISDVSMELLFN